jgi:(1->4)-alpha-D-glucan 1-alpha-D-glucosylmutase
VLQITGPGVPDVDQGSELWERSLVDPDNRRPVDFAKRRRLLARLDGGYLPPIDASGAAKLLVTSRSLRARRDRPELFDRYLPLQAFGSAAAHVVAADRGGAIPIVTRLPIGLERAGGWGDTVLPVPAGRYRDVFTGATVDGAEVLLASVLERYPVALLLREAP